MQTIAVAVAAQFEVHRTGADRGEPTHRVQCFAHAATGNRGVTDGAMAEGMRAGAQLTAQPRTAGNCDRTLHPLMTRCDGNPSTACGPKSDVGPGVGRP